MFISVLELFKIGIGPSSSHTLGPMVAARQFIDHLAQNDQLPLLTSDTLLRCTLKGSLAFTGKGHSTDRAVAMGLQGFTPEQLVSMNVDQLLDEIWKSDQVQIDTSHHVTFNPDEHIVFFIF